MGTQFFKVLNAFQKFSKYKIGFVQQVDFKLTFPRNVEPFVPKSCNHEFWSAVVRSELNNKTWVSTNNQSLEVKHLPWDRKQPSEKPGEDCVIVNENLMYQNEKCFWTFCFPCKFQQQVCTQEPPHYTVIGINFMLAHSYPNKRWVQQFTKSF